MAKIEEEHGKLRIKLENDKFVRNAPTKIIEENKFRYSRLIEEINDLRNSIQRLKIMSD